MQDDRRIARRVPLRDRSCRLQARAKPLEIGLVDISPGGACVSVGRPSGAANDLLDAWLNELPMRVYLDDEDSSAVAMPVWARGPRPHELRLLFGLRFVQPIAEFGSLVRQLLGK